MPSANLGLPLALWGSKKKVLGKGRVSQNLSTHLASLRLGSLIWKTGALKGLLAIIPLCLSFIHSSIHPFIHSFSTTHDAAYLCPRGGREEKRVGVDGWGEEGRVEGHRHRPACLPRVFAHHLKKGRQDTVILGRRINSGQNAGGQQSGGSGASSSWAESLRQEGTPPGQRPRRLSGEKPQPEERMMGKIRSRGQLRSRAHADTPLEPLPPQSFT